MISQRALTAPKDPRQGGEKNRTKNNSHLKIIQCQAISYSISIFLVILMYIVLELWCAGREIGATGHCCRFVRESHSPSSSDMGRNSWKHFGGQKIYSVKTNLFIHGILKLKRAGVYKTRHLASGEKFSGVVVHQNSLTQTLKIMTKPC